MDLKILKILKISNENVDPNMIIMKTSNTKKKLKNEELNMLISLSLILNL